MKTYEPIARKMYTHRWWNELDARDLELYMEPYLKRNFMGTDDIRIDTPVIVMSEEKYFELIEMLKKYMPIFIEAKSECNP